VSVVVIGLSHRSAALDLLERMAVGEEALPKSLHDLCARPNVSEAVVLSTCNRTEVYVVAERFHGAYQDVRDFFGDLSSLAPEDFQHHLYAHYDDEAVRHLFSVAAGLDSAVLGESEILGQVRTAWERAQAEGTARSGLNALFRHALEVGKRARTDTAISRYTTSVSQATVELAAEHLGSLEGRKVLVIGAGDMGEGMALALARAGVAEVVVANRTRQRAEALALRVGGRSVPLGEMVDAVADADVVLTSTGSSGVLVERDDLAEVMALRPGRPLLVVDVAVPRDVDPGVASLDGVTLLDLDDLRSFAEAGVNGRRAEAALVRALVDDEVLRYLDAATARQVAPLVASLHARAEDLRRRELTRQRARLAELDERQRATVEAVTRSVLAKLLHEPTVRLKDAAGTPRGERLAEALRDLFDL